MGFDQFFLLGILLLTFIALAAELWSPDAILITALGLIITAGIVPLEEAAAGFGNSILLALGSLYIVAAALRESGALDLASHFVLGKENRSIRIILLRLCPSVSIYSAFLNNTPIVAMGIPAIRSWAQRQNVLVSKLLIPLSYSAILGGICTLIGTSTNLIAHGLLQQHGLPGFHFFELAWVGVPCGIVGLCYIILISPLLTPARRDIRQQEEQKRKLLVEVEVTRAATDLIGNTVIKTHLQNLSGLYLSRINREGREIAPVDDDTVIRKDDHLFYAARDGIMAHDPELENFPGLRMAGAPPRNINRGEERERELHQIVIREGSRMAGITIGDARFFERFGAAVTGMQRRGRRVDQSLNEVTLHPGDVLLLDTGRGFREANEDSPDFFLTSEAGGDPLEEQEKEEVKIPAGGKSLYISVGVLVGIIALVASGLLHIAVAGILGVAILLTFKIIEAGDARQAIDWTVLIVIGAALGLGRAIEVSGLAKLIGQWVIQLTSAYGSRAVLAGVVIIAGILTELITNNAVVALMFPIVLSVAHTQGMDPRGLVVGITLASSLSLLTPIGYQTNLMVYGPGNYKFFDFFRVGFPLQIVLWSMLIILIPWIWPL